MDDFQFPQHDFSQPRLQTAIEQAVRVQLISDVIDAGEMIKGLRVWHRWGKTENNAAGLSEARRSTSTVVD
jgi:hypothetical protein